MTVLNIFRLPYSRQWPKVYDLCHTFLHVAQVRKHTAMRESRVSRANLACPCVETRANIAWQCVFWFVQHAKTCYKIWYLGSLPTILLSQTTWQALHAQQEMGGDCLVTDKLNIQLKIFYIETSIFIYYYFFEIHHNIVTTTVLEQNPRSHHKGATVGSWFKLATNCIQFYAIVNLDKTSLNVCYDNRNQFVIKRPCYGLLYGSNHAMVCCMDQQFTFTDWWN